MENLERKRERQRQWLAQRRSSFFEDKSCSYCGSGTNLEIHHADPTLKVSHRIFSWSEAKRTEELDKCVVLCHDCHQGETTKQRRIFSPDGMSWCVTCKTHKPVSDFHKNASNWHGLAKNCKECRKINKY